jgi:hypothetical protein
MIRRMEYTPSGTPVLMEYLQGDPPPRLLNGIYLNRLGFKNSPGNSYVKDSITIKYDGVYWWYYKDGAGCKIETVEELEKLLL